jgi:hypothetical protein
VTRLRFHKWRFIFWSIQLPFVVYVGGWQPGWGHWLFTYLCAISVAALMESALTDYDQARQKVKDDNPGETAGG